MVYFPLKSVGPSCYNINSLLFQQQTWLDHGLKSRFCHLQQRESRYFGLFSGVLPFPEFHFISTLHFIYYTLTLLIHFIHLIQSDPVNYEPTYGCFSIVFLRQSTVCWIIVHWIALQAYIFLNISSFSLEFISIHILGGLSSSVMGIFPFTL